MKTLRITLDGKEYIVDVEILKDDEQPVINQPLRPNRNENKQNANNQQKPQKQNQPKQSNSNNSGVLKAPMNGVVVEIKVNVGDSFNQGDTLVVIEAMKMKTNINAKTNGTVKSINVKLGDTVDQNAALITFE